MDADDAETDPVDPHLCVWCKLPHEGDATPLGTGEFLCSTCLQKDLRPYKRTRFVDLIVAGSLEATTRAVLLEDWHDIQARIADVHGGDDTLTMLPTRVSNADDYSVDADGTQG